MKTNNTNVFQELIKREPNFLDRPLDELLPIQFIGEAAVNAYQGLVKRLDGLPLADKQKKAILNDGQCAGKALLMIVARIGELFDSAPDAARPGRPAKRPGLTKKDIAPKGSKERRQMEHAQSIATHPKEVKEVIKEAEENEDIPTKTAVLNKIAYKKERDRQKGTREKTQLEMTGEAFIYYSNLEEALRIIPPQPPFEFLTERDFLKIKAVALLIIKRLEVFQNGTKVKSLSGRG